MPASPTDEPGSRLASLVFTDPHRDPVRPHAVVRADPTGPGAGAGELPAATRALVVEVAGAGRVRDLEAWVAETSTTSLLVLEGGEVVHEWYAAGLGPETLFLGASMSKSALAHLVGCAVRAGQLTLADRVVDHVPELRGSGYEPCTVLDVITMTTGVDWVEDHRDPDGLASRLLACFGAGTSSRALLAEVGPGEAPGTRFSYCTADSQVLDWVRERATGTTYAEDLTRLWSELGCTRDAVVAVDGEGVSLAGGGLAAASRDWARLAALAVDGLHLLDTDWVEAAARATYPFCEVGRLPSTITTHAGFGHHWWPMDADARRVTADGSRGQFACADRRTGAVVVKTSAWPYDDPWVDRQARDLSYLGLHAILDSLDPARPRSTPLDPARPRATPSDLRPHPRPTPADRRPLP